jgi:hypothetical protein
MLCASPDRAGILILSMTAPYRSLLDRIAQVIVSDPEGGAERLKALEAHYMPKDVDPVEVGRFQRAWDEMVGITAGNREELIREVLDRMRTVTEPAARAALGSILAMALDSYSVVSRGTLEPVQAQRREQILEFMANSTV